MATWLSMFFETKKEALRPDYVVTFGAPRVVASLGSNRCPRSLQTRSKAVRIVIAEEVIGILPFVDAATLLPEPPMNFCFQSLQMDNHGRLMEKNHVWPNLWYVSAINHLTVGWTLHSAEKKYEPYLLKVKEKKEKCLGKGTWCDNTAGISTLGSKPSCNKCCNGKRWNWWPPRDECK